MVLGNLVDQLPVGADIVLCFVVVFMYSDSIVKEIVLLPDQPPEEHPMDPDVLLLIIPSIVHLGRSFNRNHVVQECILYCRIVVYIYIYIRFMKIHTIDP